MAQLLGAKHNLCHRADEPLFFSRFMEKKIFLLAIKHLAIFGVFIDALYSRLCMGVLVNTEYDSRFISQPFLRCANFLMAWNDAESQT